VIELGQGLGRAATVESLLHRGRQLLRHQFFFFFERSCAVSLWPTDY
jgi:hypothetical protein